MRALAELDKATRRESLLQMALIELINHAGCFADDDPLIDALRTELEERSMPSYTKYMNARQRLSEMYAYQYAPPITKQAQP